MQGKTNNVAKFIIVTKLFEFGGSNSHLKTLIKYFGAKNTLLVLENEDQLRYLKNITQTDHVDVKIVSNLHAYAHLNYRYSTNIKELLSIVRSIILLQWLSFRHGFASITINAVEPEKHLYFLWLPWSKVCYILHSTPHPQYTPFTVFTCNNTLGLRKQLITVSYANKDIVIKNWQIAENKKKFIHVIHNCLSKEKTTQITRLAEGGMRYIVTMGHLVGYKNPEVWFNVANVITALQKDVCFIWLGDGSLYFEFKSKASSNERVRFAGFVEEPETYLATASIYYQPSLYETHGISVIEAMRFRLPCVVSDVGGLPESVESGHTGILVHPSNVQEHIEALNMLLNNPDLRQKLGDNGFEKYRRCFTFEIFKSSMDALYS